MTRWETKRLPQDGNEQGGEGVSIELWEVATLFSSCEITDEQPELMDEIIAVVIRVDASVPPILDGSDHRTPDTRLMDEQDSFLMCGRRRSLIAFTKDRLKHGAGLDADTEVITDPWDDVDDSVAREREFDALCCRVHLLQRDVDIDGQKRVDVRLSPKSIAGVQQQIEHRFLLVEIHVRPDKRTEIYRLGD